MGEMPTRPGGGLAPRIERCMRSLNAEADHETVRTLAALLDRVVEWNDKVDLTAARDPDELVDLFVADAAVVARLHDRVGEAWVDVGSGAGAPGIPLALLMNGSLTLIEPKAKRVAFLRTAVGALALDRVSVRRDRCEAIADKSFDAAISRATRKNFASGKRASAASSVSAPACACVFMIANSASLNRPGFLRMQSGIATLPMSCNGLV